MFGKGCTCQVCYLARKRYRVEFATGKRRMYPIEDAIALLEERMALTGMGTFQLSKTVLPDGSRMSATNLRRLLNGAGSGRKVTSVTLQRIRLLGSPGPSVVPRKATNLRVQALRAEGWGSEALEEEYSIRGALAGARRPTIRIANAKRVVELVETLGEGPSSWAKSWARGQGWLPRSAYDQDCLLDPFWDGEGGLLEAPVTQLERRQYERGEFIRLVTLGVKPEEAYKQVGIVRSKARDWMVVTLREAGLKRVLLEAA